MRRTKGERRDERATVRRKTLTAITVTTVVLTIVLCTISRIFLVDRFSDLEDARVADGVERAKIAVQAEIEKLDTIAVDNAVFDDTYEFMAHRTEEYIKASYGYGPVSTLARENYQALALLDTAAQMVASEGYDPARRLQCEISASLASHFTKSDRIAALPLTGIGVAGILLVKEGPMLISAHAILPSENRGPVRGVLLMGSYLKRQDLESLDRKTHLNISVGRIDDPHLEGDFAFARDHLAGRSSVFVHAFDGKAIAGYALLQDVYGMPALILKVDMTRTIYHQGQLTLLYLAAALALAGVVFGVVIELLMAKFVVSRLRLLDADVGRIAGSGDAFARVSCEGNDELARFGDAINRMLDSLQLSQSDKRRAEDRYRIFMDNSPLVAAIKDEDGRFVYVNEPYAKILRTTTEEIRGRRAAEFVIPETAAQINDHDRQVFSSGQLLQFEESIVTPDGVERKWLSFRFPLPAEGSRRLLGKLSLDITDRKRAEEELKQAKEAAESAALVKSQFLTNISHELRTPMNGIIGLTELALASQMNAEQREHISLIQFSAESLLGLINDVLDFSKLEAGKLELDPVEFDLKELLDDCVALMQILANRKGLQLLFDISRDTPGRVVGDSSRLRQVLVNLIGNAVKFTHKGEVRLTVSIASQKADEIMLHFAVSDTGVGIAEDKQQVIFERFSQADSSTTRQFGGTGLGLAISRRLVGMMNGRIEVESRVGKGSIFHFTAQVRRGTEHAEPAGRPKKGGGAQYGREEAQCTPDVIIPVLPTEEAAKPAISPSNLRILIAEDNKVNQIVIERLLKARGHAIVMAENGRIALEVLEREAFDLLITDVQMPEVDGYELVEAIRGREMRTGKRLRILGLSAHAFAEDRDKCLSAGMDAYLSKPVRTEELHQMIAELASMAASEPIR